MYVHKFPVPHGSLTTGPIDAKENDPQWNAMEAAVDREWYDQEEGGGGVDESHNPFVGDDALFEKRSTEMAKKMVRPHTFLPQTLHSQSISPSLALNSTLDSFEGQ